MTARWLPIILLAGHASAQTPVKVDSETISGLGARNIGSAAMSGRIAAVAAVQEGPRLTVYVGAASGGEIGRGACRERGENSGVAVSFKKKKKNEQVGVDG